MSGGPRGPEAGGRAILAGDGWGRWRGHWRAAEGLEGRDGDWLHRGPAGVGRRWSTLAEALDALWSTRTTRDRQPWAIGWFSFETCAAFGGGLPSHSAADGELAGVLLLEPSRCDAGEVVKPGYSGSSATLDSSLTEGAFRRGVECVREAIAAGSVYQVNLSRRFTVKPWSGGLASLFEVVAGPGRPEYLSALSWGGEVPGELVCASMELLLRRRRTRIETRPIKGTAGRGLNADEDRNAVSRLEADPKERSELAMIVDLERNDLGRVAIPGTVVVEDPGSVHTWQRVHHRVARVVAEVEEAVSWQRLLRVMAPGGSVTGCPKRRAMEVITDLEPAPRGPFTGVLGVIAGNGDVELALPIRTAWTGAGTLEMAAGCGIVWASDPVAEERESRLKISQWIELAQAAS